MVRHVPVTHSIIFRCSRPVVDLNMPCAFQGIADGARNQHNLAAAYADERGTKINYPHVVVNDRGHLGGIEHIVVQPHVVIRTRIYNRRARPGAGAQMVRARRGPGRRPGARKTAPYRNPSGRAGGRCAAAAAAKPIGKQEIIEIQTLLDAMNFNPGPVDGSLGRRTTNAIKLYQQFAGLETDGKASRELLEDLRAVAATMSGKQ